MPETLRTALYVDREDRVLLAIGWSRDHRCRYWNSRKLSVISWSGGCVDRLDRIGRADHRPDLYVVVQGRHELRPGTAPELHDRRVSVAPLGNELGEPVLRRLLGRSRIDRLEGAHDRVPVLPARVTERVADQTEPPHTPYRTSMLVLRRGGRDPKSDWRSAGLPMD